MVKKDNVGNILSLTSMQEGLLFRYLQQEATQVYVEQLILTIGGHPGIELIQSAWDRVVEANELLRTVFRWEKMTHPVQIVLKQAPLDVAVVHLSSWEQRAAFLKNDREKGLDLAQVPFRVTVLEHHGHPIEIVVTHHHILYDGWSNGIIIREFLEALEALHTGSTMNLPVKTSFQEFIRHCREKETWHQENYWKNCLEGIQGPSLLPFLDEHAVRSGHKKYLSATLDGATEERLKAFLSANHTTLAAAIYALWGIVMTRLSYSADAVFGVVLSGRSALPTNMDEVVGLFINTLPFRVKVNEQATLGELLQDVSTQLSLLSEQEHTPLKAINGYLGLDGNEPLFRSMVVIENYPIDHISTSLNTFPILKAENTEINEFDLSLSVQNREGLVLELQYESAVFSDNNIQRLLDYLLTGLERLAASTENTPVNQVVCYEQHEVLAEALRYNPVVADPPVESLISLFRKQVAEQADKEVLVCNGTSWSLGELDRLSGLMAVFLRDVCGTQSKESVILVHERNEWLLIAMLAITKLGANYIPLETGQPEERLQFILKDSGAATVFDHALCARFRQWLPQHTGASDVDQVVQPYDCAYIIYTSGSTGMPKGVIIEHRSVVNFVEAMTKLLAPEAGDTILSLTAHSFDVFVGESWFPMLAGIRMVLATEAQRSEIATIRELANNWNVSMLQATPSRLSVLLTEPDIFSSVKHVLIAGEAFPGHLASKLQEVYSGLIYNMYGPTETTVYSTGTVVTDNRKMHIGKPVSNTQVFVTDRMQKLVPFGVVGELCISGSGLARGYLHNDQLTTERFIDHPIDGIQRWYLTGDLVKQQEDGTLLYFGRMDDQVKIRGYRIEPGEIEQKLEAHPAIARVCVHTVGTGYEKELCAYYQSHKELETQELRKYLSAGLAEYMIPSYFVKVDEFVLTTSGKINRLVLPKPTVKLTEAYVAPQSELQQQLIEIWAEVLKEDPSKIGIHTNFFRAGGHSLKAMQLVALVYKKLDFRIGVNAIFTHPTVQQQESLIVSKEASTTTYQPLPISEPGTSYALSPSQERLYVLYELDPEGTSYNMPFSLKLHGRMDKQRIVQSFTELITRHEILRTVFRVEGSSPRQLVLPAVGVTLEESRVSGSALSSEYQSFVRPFDLSKGPLFRLRYVETDDCGDYLFMDFHHIITDGFSQGLLEQEFRKLYQGTALAPVRYQYRDYSEWLRSSAQQQERQLQGAYWSEVFKGTLPVLELPTDHHRPLFRGSSGGCHSIRIDRTVADHLRAASEAEGGTLFMGLLSVTTLWLSGLSNQDDIIIGSPVACRRHSDLQEIPGLFVNTLCFRLATDRKGSFRTMLSSVKDVALGAFEHQEYGFEELVTSLDIPRDMGRNPLFDVMLVFQNQEMLSDNNPLYQLDDSVASEASPKFDLLVDVREDTAGLVVDLTYNKDLFEPATIAGFCAYFETILGRITKGEDSIKKLQSLPAKEVALQLDELSGSDAEGYNQELFTGLFSRTVAKKGSEIAVYSGSETATYEQLWQESEKVSAYLRTVRSIEPGDRVGVLVPRGITMLVSMLGILKSGGCYVPIDPEYPRERIDYLLSDSDCRCVIDQQEWSKISAWEGTAASPVELSGSDLAYIIYTSGSTGLPKGVMITHANLSAFLWWSNKEFAASDYTIVFAGTSICFDLSVFELFYPLTVGKPIRILENGLAIGEHLPLHDRVLVNTVPSVLGALLAASTDLSSVSVLNLAGEPIPKEYTTKLDYSRMEVRNLYGPSEDTTYSTMHRIEKSGDVELIGRTLPGTRAYVLSENGELVYRGSAGELCLSGLGLSAGYLNREALTAEKFTTHPFNPGERIYRTGDLVRWTKTGELEYLGRIDNQVKIRGYRIELGEIETALRNLPGVLAGVVLAQETAPGNRELVAYVVTESGTNTEAFKRELREHLPGYMVPEHYVEIQELPLTANGKIDRKALPAFTPGDTTQAYTGPRNETDQKLIAIWASVLGIPPAEIGIDHGFFELGGNSLKVTVLLAEIYKEMNLRLPMQQVFKMSSIRAISDYILALETLTAERTEPAKNTLKL